MLITDFNTGYLTPLLEKLNRENTIFLMEDRNIILMKVDNVNGNFQF